MYNCLLVASSSSSTTTSAASASATTVDDPSSNSSSRSKKICAVCNNLVSEKNIIYDYNLGEQICKICGAVIGEQRNNDFFTIDSIIDTYHIPSDATFIEDRGDYMLGHESKYYGTKGSGLSGVGGNVITSFTKSMDFSSSGIMSSQIDGQNRDFNGVKIKDTKTMNRLRRINNITSCPSNRNANEKNIKQVVIFIKQISQKKNFPLVVQEDTVNLYRKISAKNKKKRLQYRITAYWCLYYTLRKNNLTTSLPEFLSWLIDLGFIDRAQKAVTQRKINKVQVLIFELLDLPIIPHSDYILNITSLCNKHGLDEIIKRQCLELGNIITAKCGSIMHQGRSPKTIATMLIAIIMTKENMREQCKDLLKDLKVTTVILKKILQEVMDNVDQQGDPLDDDVFKIRKLLSVLEPGPSS